MPEIPVGLVREPEGRIYGNEHYDIVQHLVAALEIAAVILPGQIADLLLYRRQIALRRIGLCRLVRSRMPVVHGCQNDLGIDHDIVSVGIMQDEVRAHTLVGILVAEDVAMLVPESLFLIIVTALLESFCSKEIVQDDLAPVALSLVPAFQRIGEIVGLVSDAERLLAQIPYGIFDVVLEALGGLGAGLAVAVEGFLHAADVLVEAFRYMPEGLAGLAVELFLARLEKPFGLGGHPGLESLELLLQSLTVGCLELGHSIGMALFQKFHGPVMVLGCISESLFQKADIRIEPGTFLPELRHKDGTAHKICHKGGQCHG